LCIFKDEKNVPREVDIASRKNKKEQGFVGIIYWINPEELQRTHAKNETAKWYQVRP
jgi:hypothetical protein